MKPVIVSSMMLLVPAVAVGQSSTTQTAIPGSAPQMLEVVPMNPIELPAPGPASTVSKLPLASGATAGLAANAMDPTSSNFARRITFSEFPEQTAITNQYRDRGIILGGSGPVITPDAAAPASPVLAGTPLFEGDITGQFVIPGTDQPSAVYQFTWDIGEFNDIGTVQMELFGPAGQTLYSGANDQTGYFRYSVRGGNVGVASWRFHAVATEPAGFGIDNLFFSIPGRDDLGREMGATACALGNPVNPAVGNKFQLETDYRSNRPFPLVVTRAYNSISGNWTFFPSVTHLADSLEAKVTRPDGKVLTYTGQHFNADWRPSSTDMTGELQSLLDGAGNISGWRYRTLDDQVETYDATGLVVSVKQRSGITHTYSYSPDAISISHSLGNSLSFSLDTTGKVIGFTAPDGESYSYQYDQLDRLAGVGYPASSGGRAYHYENAEFPDLLTGISDANGDRYATWAYDSNRRALISEHHGSAERTSFDYTYTDSTNQPRTTVTNALGRTTTYYYTTVNGARKLYYVDGHQSANCAAANKQYSFDQNAFIRSTTDWNGNITQYLRDSKGREQSRTEAVGTALEKTVQTEWHSLFNLPTVITDQQQRTDFTYDTNGNLIQRQASDTGRP